VSHAGAWKGMNQEKKDYVKLNHEVASKKTNSQLRKGPQSVRCRVCAMRRCQCITCVEAKTIHERGCRKKKNVAVPPLIFPVGVSILNLRIRRPPSLPATSPRAVMYLKDKEKARNNSYEHNPPSNRAQKNRCSTCVHTYPL
jgi:hypothetical protein